MNGLDGIEVLFRPAVIRPHSVWEISTLRGPALVAHSATALNYILAGVRWHDDFRCPTWIDDGCRCDVEANP